MFLSTREAARNQKRGKFLFGVEGPPEPITCRGCGRLGHASGLASFSLGTRGACAEPGDVARVRSVK